MRRLLLVFAALLWVLCPAVAWAALPVDPTVDGYDLSTEVWLLEDPSGSLTIDDVTAPQNAARFERTTQRYPTLGLSDSAVWVRIELQNDAEVEQERLLELVRGTIDQVEVHFPPGSEPRVMTARRHAPYSERVVPYRYPIFPVTLPPKSQVVLHLRLWSESELYFPVRLWSRSGFHEHETSELMLLAAYYGLVFTLALYHLALFARLRDRYLLYFALYIALIGAWMSFVDGLPHGLIGSVASALGNSSYAITGAIGVSFTVLFTQEFLDTRRKLPRMHKCLHAGHVYAAFVLVGHLFLSWRVINMGGLFFWVVMLPWMLATGLLAWRAGVRDAGLYSIAWFVWVLGGVLAAMGISGWLAIPPQELFNPWRWAMLVEAIVMSLALAGRIQALGRERAEAAALAAAQGQLVEAEKSAVLGRLMAGILHEVNTPLGALRSSAATLADTFAKLDRRIGEDDKKLRRTVTAGTKLTETLDTSSARIVDVIDSLKRFVAVDEAEKKRVDLRHGIEGALTLLAPSLAGVVVKRSLPDEPVMLLCAPAKLNQAILELVQRSAKALDGDGMLRVALEAREDAIVLVIEDDGSEVEDIDSLFDFAFVQDEGRMRMRMGLPLAKHTIDELGGTVRASRDDGTTSVRVTFPR